MLFLNFVLPSALLRACEVRRGANHLCFFRCGFAALRLCSKYSFTVTPEEPLYLPSAPAPSRSTWTRFVTDGAVTGLFESLRKTFGVQPRSTPSLSGSYQPPW